MELYLVQHAESKTKEEDPERGLTDLGFVNVRKTSEFVKKLDISVETIFHSNKLRAKQTANELAVGIKSVTGLKQREGIAPMDDICSMKDEIQGSDKNLMVVGHLPYMAKLASALLCENENQNVVSFQNGCIVKLVRDEENKGWSVKWMITPDIC
jgi:phosphohistidine phosphatase